MIAVHSAIERLSDFIEQRLTTLNAPGIAIGVTTCERIYHANYWGFSNQETNTPVYPKTLFQIGSISKSFASIALLKLQEDGLVQLDDPLRLYLPWFEIQTQYAPITLRHLLSHTAGIVTGADESISAFTEAWSLRHTRTSAPPGEFFHYSNSGYKILGLVLENVLKKDLASILREYLFTPLGMSESLPDIRTQDRHRLATGYEPYYNDRPLPPGGKLAPARWFESNTADGSISSNVVEMCLYLQSLLQQGKKLLSPQSFAELITPAVTTGDGLHGEAYGLGLFTQEIDGHHVIGHSGGMVGFTADMLADLDADLGVIVLTNGPAEPSKISRYVLALFRAALEGKPLPDFHEDDVENPDNYVGMYRSGEKSFTLRKQEKRLALDLGSDTVYLTSLAPDLFAVPHPSFAQFALRMGRADDRVTEAAWGGERYVRVGSGEEAEFQHPAEWDAYPGHYVSHNPWFGHFRILFYKEYLLIFYPSGEAERLFPLEDALFRIGDDPRSPEFLRFDVLIDGKAMQASYSGGLYSRTFVP